MTSKFASKSLTRLIRTKRTNPAALWLMKTCTFPIEISKERVSNLADENAKC